MYYINHISLSSCCERCRTMFCVRSQPSCRYVLYLFKRLPANIREKVARGVISKWYETPVMCQKSFKKYLASTLTEVLTVHDQLIRRRAEQRLNEIQLAKEEAETKKRMDEMRNAVPLSKKEMRALEKEKHKNQRQLDNAKVGLDEQRSMYRTALLRYMLLLSLIYAESQKTWYTQYEKSC